MKILKRLYSLVKPAKNKEYKSKESLQGRRISKQKRPLPINPYYAPPYGKKATDQDIDFKAIKL